MKSLNKLALVAAISAAPFAHAELVAMDDASMSAATGQAGLTIEIEAQISIGEVDYQDAGHITISNVVLGGDGVAGGANSAFLDEFALVIDVSDGSGDTGAVMDKLSGGNTVNDGDLVIHLAAADEVDFGLTIGSFGLNGAGYAVGSKTDTTTLVSNINLIGGLSLLDIIVHNNDIDESGDVIDLSLSTGAANDGTLDIDALFDISGSMDFNAFGVSLGGLVIGDTRGAKNAVATAVGGLAAHASDKAYASMDMGLGGAATLAANTDVLALRMTFQGDVDMTDIAVGGTSIGNLYMTDVNFAASTKIYGH